MNAPDRHTAFEDRDGVRIYWNLVQRSDEWMALRRGIITASEMGLLITPSTLKRAANDKARSHVYQIAAQRITGHTEEGFFGWDMERGLLEEQDARNLYRDRYAPVDECGFVINTGLGFPLGCSPDGLVGDDGMIEIKSRKNHLQMKTLAECMFPEGRDIIPPEYMMQVQTALFVTRRKWCDFISYSNGFNMAVIRVEPIAEYQEAIGRVAMETEDQVREIEQRYRDLLHSKSVRVIEVERVDYSDEISI